MLSPILGPRKRRTRQHVIADLSVHHAERFILEEGRTAQRLSSDYGYDLVMRTFDEQGCAEPGAVLFQCKATESMDDTVEEYAFDLSARDYNLWKREESPVILVLFDTSRRRAYWLAIQRYFMDPSSARPKPGAKHVWIRIPRRQVLNRRAIARFRDLKGWPYPRVRRVEP